MRKLPSGGDQCGEGWTHMRRQIPVPQLRPLRFGVVEGLRAQPLIRGLNAQGNLHVETLAPAPLRARFQAEQYDAALLPLLDCATNHLGRSVPGLGVATHGPAHTEQLLTTTPPERLTRLGAADDAGVTTALARIVLAERFGATPKFVPAARDTWRDDGLDGFVATGTEGLGLAARDGETLHDLGALWHELTGLPYVHLLWTGRFQAPYKQLRLILSRAHQQGMADLDAIAGEIAAQYELSQSRVLDLLLHELQFTLGQDAMEGAHAFLALAKKHALCPEDAEILLC